MDTTSAWVILNMVEGIGPLRVRALLNLCGGDPREILRFGTAETAGAGIPKSVTARLAAWRKLPWEKEIERALKSGISIVGADNPAYPALLKEIPDGPLVLYVKGTLPANLPSVGIVGTRNPSTFGITMAGLFASGLSRRNVCVVSGLARGVDIAAHRACLRAHGATVAVLGSGLEQLYPREHAETAQEIARSGAVISEFPLDMPPNKGNFPRRNRIISGMSKGVVVIEAGLKSGALITAGFAVEQNRDVWVLPADAGRLRGRGNNLLLRQGAYPVEDPAEVLEMLGIPPENKTVCTRGDGSKTLDQRESEILAILHTNPMRIDEIVETSSMTAAEVSRTVTSLQVKGFVSRDSGGCFKAEKLAPGGTEGIQ